MLDRQTAPLEIARTVLRPETIREVCNAGFTNSAYLILDRWALNQPDELRRLETLSTLGLIVTLSQQQTRESERAEQRFSVGSESARDERLGYFAERRHRYQPENYHIVPEDRLGHGGAKSKFADNIAAIRLLKDLQERKVDVAGPDEKKILVRYVGWGGLPQAFDARNEKWAAEYQELQNLLAPDEYAKARRSTQGCPFHF